MQLSYQDLIHYLVFILVLLIYYKARESKLEPTDSPNTRLRPSLANPGIEEMQRAASRARDEDIEFLKTCLAHPHEDIAAEASLFLSKMDNPQALEALMLAIHQLDQEIHASSLPDPVHSSYKSENELGVFKIHARLMQNKREKLKPYENLGDTREAILGLIANPLEDLRDRHAGTLSLKAFSKPPSGKTLQSLLISPDPLIQQGAIDLISHFQLPGFTSGLESATRSPHQGVQIEALYALCELGSVNSVPVIRNLSQDYNPLIREAARYVIERLSYNSPPSVDEKC